MQETKTIITCDLCHKEIEHFYNSIAYEVKVKRKPLLSFKYKTIDVCKDCMEKIINTIEVEE